MRVIDIPVPYRFDGRSTGSNGLVDHDLLNLAVSFRRVPWASSHFAPKKTLLLGIRRSHHTIRACLAGVTLDYPRILSVVQTAVHHGA